MATDQRNLPAYFNVDADFQAWVAGIHAQLLAVGLVNTADTGQINPATVTKPSAGGAAQGYEIWRFNDTLQATVPVFVKFEYGSGATLDRPGLWFTVGSGSNGAGTLIGQVGARRSGGSGISKSAGVTLPSYFCGDGSGLVYVTNYDSTNASCGYFGIIDRLRDGAGAPVADGISTWLSQSQQSSSGIQIIPALSPVPAGYTTSGTGGFALSPAYFSATNAAPAIVGVNVPVVPFMAICGKFFFVKMAHLGIPSTLSYGVAISAATLGGTHTLMPLSASSNVLPSQYSDAFMMLWE